MTIEELQTPDAPDTEAAGIAFVQKVATAVPDVLYVYDIGEGRNVYCNREIAAVLGYTPQEVIDFDRDLFARLLHPDDAVMISGQHDILRSSEDDALIEMSYRMRHRDGSWRWLHSRETVFARDDQGNVVQKLGVARDITAERKAGRELTEAVERYSSLVSVLSDWVWELDVDGVYTWVSPKVTELLGYAAEEMLGKTGFDFMASEEASRVKAAFEKATAARTSFEGIDHAMIAKNGSLFYMEASGTPIFHTDTGAWLGYRGVNRDITARHTIEAEREALLTRTRQRADEDSLTGFLNRHAFEQALRDLLELTISAGSEAQASAILLIDLDSLKFFNDTYGHSTGDGVLLFVADALRSCCQPGDIVARLGGDEFAILLPCRDRAAAESRLTAIKYAVSRAGYRPPRRTGSDTEPIAIPITVSGGVAVMPDDGGTVLAVTDAADKRLYEDKTNTHLVWSEDLRARLSANLSGFAALDALVAAVAAKDRYTLRHSEDVLIYAALIGEELGLPANELEALKVAALLHDAGKIGVPERLLRLPGPLSTSEYETIKLHSALGAALVHSAAPEIDRQMPSVVPAIRHHHERWDGGAGGYPDQLAGADIPFHARILAVADAFSAMTTDRPYRHGAPHPEALARLCAGAGTQWDSQCVAALIAANAATC